MAKATVSEAVTMVNSFNKARNERMTIKAGSSVSKNFVVIHNSNAYNVVTDGKQVLSCDCPHHFYRKATCKHMIKVSMKKNMDIALPAEID